MHIETKLTLTGVGAVLLLSAIESLLSTHFHFFIGWLWPVSLVVWYALTYWAANHLNLAGTLTFGAFLGLADSTAGWKLAEWLGADPDHHLQKITFSLWSRIVVLVMIYTTGIALVAFLVVSYRNKREGR